MSQKEPSMTQEQRQVLLKKFSMSVKEMEFLIQKTSDALTVDRESAIVFLIECRTKNSR